MEMTKDVILARQLRLATISNLVGQGILDEPSAKELLSGALEPGNNSTIVDDSALLGDPEALVKIAAEQSVQADLPVCTCLYTKSCDDMSLDPDCPVHGSASR